MTTTDTIGNIELPATGVWELDPARSQISFTTTHFFGSAKVHGTFDVSSGRIVVSSPIESSSALAVIDAGSVNTGIKLRDMQVRSRLLLKVAAHPDISFASTGLTRSRGTWILRGGLTVRGSTAPVELTVTEAATDSQGLRLEASATIDRRAHGVTRFPGMAGRRLEVVVTVRATRS